MSGGCSLRDEYLLVALFYKGSSLSLKGRWSSLRYINVYIVTNTTFLFICVSFCLSLSLYPPFRSCLINATMFAFHFLLVTDFAYFVPQILLIDECVRVAYTGVRVHNEGGIHAYKLICVSILLYRFA